MERCFFLGHRDAERTLLTALEAVTEKLAVQEHVQEFYVGAYGSFDEMAAEAVLSLKEKHPGAGCTASWPTIRRRGLRSCPQASMACSIRWIKHRRPGSPSPGQTAA